MMTSCFAKWSLLVGVYSQVPQHLLRGINELWSEGYEAYGRGDYAEAVANFERLLISYRMQSNLLTSCHNKCHIPNVEFTRLDFDSELEDSEDGEHFYFKHLLEQSSCLKDCFLEHPFSRLMKEKKPHYSVQEAIDSFEIYNYLQISYHNLKDGLKAANSAYTFLSLSSKGDPGWDDMMHNLEFYKNNYRVVKQAIKEEQLVNYESAMYNKHYKKGVESYEKSDHKSCVEHMEKALLEFFNDSIECESLCYKMPRDFDSLRESWTHLAQMEMEVNECRIGCRNKMAAEVWSKRNVDTPQEILQYLQYCYYQQQQILKGANAAKTLAVIVPKDETAQRNFKYYSSVLEKHALSQSQLHPRQDVLEYVKKSYQKDHLSKLANRTLLNRDDIAHVIEEEPELLKEQIIRLMNEQKLV